MIGRGPARTSGRWGDPGAGIADRLPPALRRLTTDADLPLRQAAYQSPLRDERLAAYLGASLGILFSVCFVTGLYSHLQQHPQAWLPIPARPAGLYRLSQGIHVAAGIASVPVLVAKLWLVWPRFVAFPPVKRLSHLVERIGLFPLVGGGIFMAFSGVANIAQWYPWRFSFTASHFWMAWVTMGAVTAHVGAKWAIARRALARPSRRPRLADADPVLGTRAESTLASGVAGAERTGPARGDGGSAPGGAGSRGGVVGGVVGDSSAGAGGGSGEVGGGSGPGGGIGGGSGDSSAGAGGGSGEAGASAGAVVGGASTDAGVGGASAGAGAGGASTAGATTAGASTGGGVGGAVVDGASADGGVGGASAGGGLGGSGGLSRRGLLGTVAAASGLLTLTTVGQTFRPLRALGLLAPRDPARGPQGYPVNRGARNAGVVDLARSPDYRLTVGGRVATPLSLDHAQLLALPAHDTRLPIACVEGWSYSAAWQGVRVRDLLAMAGAAPDRTVLLESLEPNGAYRTSTLNPGQAADRDTLLATHLDGQVLAVDHGFPCRLIAPNRPGVLQTKWVTKVTVL
jgi:hypothetical protein